MKESRQVIRRELFRGACASVRESNLSKVLDQGHQVGWSGMKRGERRKLARAYAANAWKDISARKRSA